MIANPWVVLGVVLFYLGSLGVVGWKAYGMGGEHVIAEQVEDEAKRVAEREQVLSTVADAIGSMRTKNVTIRQKAETITRERVVYANCKHDAGGVRLINEALTGEAQPAAAGELPATRPTD